MFRRVAILGPVISVVLRILGYTKTREWLQGRLASQAHVSLESSEIVCRLEMTCRMVRAVERYSIVSVTCLEESLLLWYLLGRQGITVTIRIGVRKPAGKFEAHAWVERDGIALNQTDEQHRHYHPFDNDFPKPPAEAT
jgi:hypothetical protein